MALPSYWTEERVEKMVALRTAGKSFASIARELGDISRNAVIGKVRRIKLDKLTPSKYQEVTPPKPKPLPKPPIPAPMPRPKPAPVARPAAPIVAKPVVIAASEPTPLGPIGAFPDRLSCRYIHGSGATFQCCAQPGFPWCSYHAAICLTTPAPMKR